MSNELIEEYDNTLSYAGVGWSHPEEDEGPTNTETDLVFGMQSRQSNRVGPVKQYYNYGAPHER